MTTPRRTTLQNVAEKAGVSHSTVSLILNGRGKELRISDETCQKVIDTARALNYQANYFARSLRGKSTHTLAILWFFSGPHSEDGVIRRVTEQALKQGYIAHFFDSMSDRSVVLRILQELSRRSVDGIIFRTTDRRFIESTEGQRLLGNFRAAVVVAQDFDACEGDVVVHSRTTAMQDAVAHLVASGRKRLLMIGGNYPKFDIARAAWVALGRKESDVELRDVNWYRSPDRVQSIRDALDSVPWEGPGAFDALLCSADEMAFISINHLRERGIAVPKQVGVIGFNDNAAAPFFTPPVASVARDDLLVVDRALEFLFARLEDNALPRQHAEVPMRLVLRESAGKAKRTRKRPA